jgi:two-component system sensor histidine kinase AlgZ
LLEDLSDLFRYALAEPHLTTTLAQEIELAQRYLSIEQVRFGERLQMQWQLDESVHGALLPPLLLQPLVENAIRHGVEPNARGGKLQVRTERRGNRR